MCGRFTLRASANALKQCSRSLMDQPRNRVITSPRSSFGSVGIILARVPRVSARNLVSPVSCIFIKAATACLASGPISRNVSCAQTFTLATFP